MYPLGRWKLIQINCFKLRNCKPQEMTNRNILKAITELWENWKSYSDHNLCLVYVCDKIHSLLSVFAPLGHRFLPLRVQKAVALW